MRTLLLRPGLAEKHREGQYRNGRLRTDMDAYGRWVHGSLCFCVIPGRLICCVLCHVLFVLSLAPTLCSAQSASGRRNNTFVSTVFLPLKTLEKQLKKTGFAVYYPYKIVTGDRGEFVPVLTT